MGLMKSLFGNRGAQQVAENKLVITEVGPNPAQVIAIAQNYFPEDPTGIATVLNDNILEGQSTIITLPETESLYEMQQALDNAGASTYIQKNWQDEEDAPVILDGICEELLLAKKNIELFGGEAFIVFDTDESVGAALLIMDAGASGADTLKVMLNYLDVNMAEANAQVNELAMGKSQLIKGSLGLLKRMKKQLDAVHVTSELMLDMDEDETEEDVYDDTYEKSAAGLHCMNCGAEIASGSKFCPKCGTKVEEAQKMFCSQCGNEIMPGAKFCTKCGARCM